MKSKVIYIFIVLLIFSFILTGCSKDTVDIIDKVSGTAETVSLEYMNQKQQFIKKELIENNQEFREAL